MVRRLIKFQQVTDLGFVVLSRVVVSFHLFLSWHFLQLLRGINGFKAQELYRGNLADRTVMALGLEWPTLCPQCHRADRRGNKTSFQTQEGQSVTHLLGNPE